MRTGLVVREYLRPHCRLCLRRRHTSNPYNFIRRGYACLKCSRKKQGWAWSLDLKELYAVYDSQEGRCALSGEVMTYQSTDNNENDSNISLDRIDGDKGYENGNIQLVCKRINLMRHTATVKDFKQWCTKVSENR